MPSDFFGFPLEPAGTVAPNAPIYELISDPKASQVLPSLGAIITQLEHLTNSADTPIPQITELIRTDQGLTVKILRLANSAFYAPAEPILNIDEAVLFLGLTQIRRAILTAKLIEKSSDLPDDLLDWHQFWLHEIAVAVILQHLAQYMRPLRMPEEAYYLMGLLHDIGKLALAILSPKLFEDVLRETARRRCDISPVEIELVGLNHASIGAWYLQQQGLPPSLYEAIRIHHSWAYSPGSVEEAAMINLADQIAHLFRIGQSGSFFLTEWNPEESPEWAFFKKQARGALPKWPDLLLDLWEKKLKNVPAMVETFVRA
ncbi:MAG: HDOD domain-containing protein [Verrucomicrobium sp.]|nr:HDOD domain-containing protein [Verrucomicrobium sp.]